MDHPKDQPLCLVLDFQGIYKIQQRKKPSYFPLNPGWLIGIPILAYEIIPIQLGSFSSPINHKQPGARTFHCSILYMSSAIEATDIDMVIPDADPSLMLKEVSKQIATER